MEHIYSYEEFSENVLKQIKNETIKHIFLIDGDNCDHKINDLFIFYDHTATEYEFHIILFYKNKSIALDSKFRYLKNSTIIFLDEQLNIREYIFKTKKLCSSNKKTFILIYNQNGRMTSLVRGKNSSGIRRYGIFYRYICLYSLMKGIREDCLGECKMILLDIKNFETWCEIFMSIVSNGRDTFYSTNKNDTLSDLRHSITLLVLLDKFNYFELNEKDKLVEFGKINGLNSTNIRKWLYSGNFYHMTNCIKMKIDIFGPKILKIVKDTINKNPNYLCGNGMYQTKTSKDIYFYLYKKINNNYCRMDSKTLYNSVDIFIQLQENLSQFEKVEFEFAFMQKDNLFDVGFSNWRTISKCF